MRTPRRPSSILGLLLVGALAGCGGDASDGSKPAPPVAAPGAAAAAPAGGVAQPATLEGLVARFQALRKAGDAAGLQALAASTIPSTTELAAVLRSGPERDAFLSKYPLHDMKADDPRVAELGKGLFEPSNGKQTEVLVHASTTEELAAYAKGTMAFEEFPGGCQRFARLVAAPGRTWYVVELVAPGEASGMKYSIFTKLGDRFLFVSKPWRAMPEPR